MKLIVNSKTIENVPLNEYYIESYKHKGLIFIQHGYTSNKDYGADFLAMHLARKGFFIISIDAYKHGERMEEPYLSNDEKMMLYESPYVVRHTAIDIIKLHKRYYQNQFPKYDFIGVSMGGMIAYYLATKTNKIKKLIPVISTPDFVSQAKHFVSQSGFDETTFLNEDVLSYLERISPLTNRSKLHYESMFIMCGKKDPVVPMGPSVAFYETYETDQITMKVYDVDHNVNREMQMDIFDYITK